MLTRCKSSRSTSGIAGAGLLFFSCRWRPIIPGVCSQAFSPHWTPALSSAPARPVPCGPFRRKRQPRRCAPAALSRHLPCCPALAPPPEALMMGLFLTFTVASAFLSACKPHHHISQLFLYGFLFLLHKQHSFLPSFEEAQIS